MKKLLLLVLALILCLCVLVACDEPTEPPAGDTPGDQPGGASHTCVFGEWVTVLPVTGSTNGLEERRCVICDEKEERAIVVTESVGLSFALNDDYSSYWVTGIGTCKDTEIYIPATYKGLPVTAISASAFSCTRLTSITIPDSVTSIGTFAFMGCANFVSITIPDSVTIIGNDAFYGCTGIIQKENGVSYVDKWAIDHDKSVTSVVLRSGTVGIGNWAFYDCRNLTSITIPSSVTKIGSYAFSGTRLASVTFENPNGWYVTWTQDATSGTELTLTSATQNASYLGTYMGYWYRK